MSNFIVSKFFAERKKLNIQLFSVENIDFELMALTDEQQEEVKELATSSAEMIAMCADMGLSYDRNRVYDDAELAKDIDKLWAQDAFDIDIEPSVKEQVGVKIIEISGLIKSLEAMIAEEAEEHVVDFNDLDQENTTLADIEQLNADAEMHAQARSA